MSYQGKWMCSIQDAPSRSDSKGEWMSLTNLSCPARECNSRASLSLVCSQDGNNIYMNEYGKIKCALSRDSEGIHIGDVCQSKWKCGNDSLHKGEYIRSDFERFMFVISEAVKFRGEGSSSWLVTLISSLGRQFNK